MTRYEAYKKTARICRFFKMGDCAFLLDDVADNMSVIQASEKVKKLPSIRTVKKLLKGGALCSHN